MPSLAQSLVGSASMDTALDSLFSALPPPPHSSKKQQQSRKRKQDQQTTDEELPRSVTGKDKIIKTEKSTAPAEVTTKKAKKEKKAKTATASEHIAEEGKVDAAADEQPAAKKQKRSAKETAAPAVVSEGKAEPAEERKAGKKGKGKVAVVPVAAVTEVAPVQEETKPTERKARKDKKAVAAIQEETPAISAPTVDSTGKKSRKAKKDATVAVAETETKESAIDDAEDDDVVIEEDGSEAGDAPSEDDDDSDDSDYDDTPEEKSAKRTRRQVKEDIKEKNRRTLFVGNLPLKATERAGTKELKNLFAKHGALESIRFRSIARNEKMPRRAAFITKNFHPGRDTLNAYVVYKDKASVTPALVENGQIFLGNHIRVDVAQKDNDGKHDHKRSVFVGALPFDVAEEKLWTFFAQAGDVEGVRIVRDKATNVGKGVGYVLFKDRAAVTIAMRMHGSDFEGRKLRISKCRDVSPAAQLRRASATEGQRASKSDTTKGGKLGVKAGGGVSKIRSAAAVARSGSWAASGRGGRGGARGGGASAGRGGGGRGGGATGASPARGGRGGKPPPGAESKRGGKGGKPPGQKKQVKGPDGTMVKKARHVPRTPKA
ncbi:Nucleolar protein 12 [Thoreauomyces humboldtii]|nr:Nucleolar protein 12 [Thoreauomyces humboldtii]